MAAAKDPSGPATLLLVDYFVDPALSTLKQQYAGLVRDGFTTIGSLDLGQPRLLSVCDSQAVVVTCATNSLHLIMKATGKPVPGRAGDPTPTPNGIRATMVLMPSGVWKLARGDGEDGLCTGFDRPPLWALHRDPSYHRGLCRLLGPDAGYRGGLHRAGWCHRRGGDHRDRPSTLGTWPAGRTIYLWRRRSEWWVVGVCVDPGSVAGAWDADGRL